MKKHILIVDDSSADLYMLETLLKGHGYDVATAENGEQALEKARLDPPDLVVSDILMPVMDGYNLCREWKADDTLRRRPFALYTATYMDSKSEALALDLGVDRFILKPQEPDVLIGIIRELLGEGYRARQVEARSTEEEMELCQQYNEVLFNKLEQKMQDLETANRKLRLSEESYRRTFANASDVICTVDKNLIVSSISPSVERVLGYTEQDFVGRPVTEFEHRVLTPESFARATADVATVLGGQTIDSTVYEFIAGDGTLKYGEVSGSPLMQDGRITGIVSVARDITDRVLATRTLRESEASFQELFNNAPVGYFEYDTQGCIHRVNRTCLEMLGYQPEDVVGQPAWKFVMDEKARQQIMARLSGTLAPFKGVERSYRRKDGAPLTVLVQDRLFYDEQGQIKGIRCTFQDITDIKQAQENLQTAKEQLLQAEKLASLGRLSAGVAHEILNPVNIISMELQMLMAKDNVPPDVLEELKICMAQIERIVGITQDLKQLARVPSNKTVMADINDIVAHILNLYDTQLKIEKIETKVHYQRDLPMTSLDKGKIEQVILNLITNAVDAMEGKENKVLRVRTDLEKTPGDADSLRITVADNGTGISRKHRSVIYEPFFTTKESGKGTGLGLPISYSIVEDHGGTLRADNNEWGGASFHVRLPVTVKTDV